MEDIHKYLDALVKTLVPIAMGDFSSESKYRALQALGTVASTAEKQMKPYTADLLVMLEGIAQNPALDHKVHGSALLCTGHLAAAVGRENFPAEKLE